MTKSGKSGCIHSPVDIIEGLRIQPLILADSACPLKDWLIKPYIFSPNVTRSVDIYEHLH